MLHNKYAIGTVVGTALLGLAKSSLLGSKNDGVTVESIKKLRRYANDPKKAHLVTTVILERYRLTTVPPEIGNLTSLKYLNLGSNLLTTLPKEIGNLTKLEKLLLEGNQLRTLPKEIGNLTNLDYLSLSVNDLTTLPKEIGNLKNLEELCLHGNQLRNLPPEIGKLTNLKWLDLSVNQLTTLPHEIGNLTNLKELNLRNNRNLKITLNFVVDMLNTYQNTYIAGKIREYIHQQTIPARQAIRMR